MDITGVRAGVEGREGGGREEGGRIPITSCISTFFPPPTPTSYIHYWYPSLQVGIKGEAWNGSAATAT